MYVQAGERRAHGNIHKENIKNELPALADANKRTLPETSHKTGSHLSPAILQSHPEFAREV